MWSTANVLHTLVLPSLTYGLEAYKAVAEFYAHAPLYKLGGEALSVPGPKTWELLQKGASLEEGAAKMRGSAGLGRTLLARLRQLEGQLLGRGGHNADEAAALEAKIKQLENGVQELQAGASEVESLAVRSKRYIDDAQADINAYNAAVASGNLENL